MSHDIIQANYDTLEEVAQIFAEAAHGIEEMLQEVRGGRQNLEGEWIGYGSGAFFSEMDDDIRPAGERLRDALAEASGVTRPISTTIHTAEEEAAALFQEQSMLPLTSSNPGRLFVPPRDVPIPSGVSGPPPVGPPPIPVPGAPPGAEWKGNPNPQNRRGGSWGPTRPVPIPRGERRGQPSASWDPEGHWDVDAGRGNRQQYDEDGNPISAEEAHNPSSNEIIRKPSPAGIPDDVLTKVAEITGLTGAALVTYLIISEGLRILFPPRNLVPIP